MIPLVLSQENPVRVNLEGHSFPLGAWPLLEPPENQQGRVVTFISWESGRLLFK